MRKFFILVTILAAIVIMACNTTAAPAAGPSESVKAKVQVAMSDFVEAKLEANDGFYPIAGMMTEFDYLHDGIKQKGDQMISCADFKLGDDVFDVDYYVEERDGAYVVVKEVFHKKNGEEVGLLWKAE